MLGGTVVGGLRRPLDADVIERLLFRGATIRRVSGETEGFAYDPGITAEAAGRARNIDATPI